MGIDGVAHSQLREDVHKGIEDAYRTESGNHDLMVTKFVLITEITNEDGTKNLVRLTAAGPGGQMPIEPWDTAGMLAVATQEDAWRENVDSSVGPEED